MALGIPREATDALKDLSNMKDELVRMRRTVKDIRDLLDEQNKILAQLIEKKDISKEAEEPTNE